MTAAAIAISLIASLEGFCEHPYQCPAKIWTIGYGTTRVAGCAVNASTPRVTRAEAERLLLGDMHDRMEQVDSMVRVWLNDNQRAALYSFAYNVGVGAFKSSTLLARVNAGLFDQAADEFPKWVYAAAKLSPGLQNRRARERALFLTPE